VHQHLSPNDNRLHGAAKASWRADVLDFSDDVAASLALLDRLDWATEDTRGYFARNLQLDDEAPTLEATQALIKGSKLVDNEYYADCLYNYRVAMRLDARGVVPESPKSLESALDGRKWQ
jgi:hypothetical protein